MEMTVLDQVDAGSVKVLLASKSPRRRELLKHVIPDFEVCAVECDEVYPKTLAGGDIAVYLSQLKSRAVAVLESSVLLITADTIVWMDGRVYGKPNSVAEARRMLGELSGERHHVYTGVTLRLGSVSRSFVSGSLVKFEQLPPASIAEYVAAYNPLDKAGAYGIQDCLGEDGNQMGPLAMSIEDGSYWNVVGLPVEDIKRELTAFTGI